jgi:hypothetical protein
MGNMPLAEMDSKPLAERPVVFVACQVFKDLLERHLPDDLSQQVKYLDYGLHQLPKKIGGELQAVLDSIEEPSLVTLGFGLCGNGLNGVRSRKHALLIPCVDDCIAMLLGSHEAFMKEFEAVPGTYYLSKGWLESGSHPLQEFEEYVDKYGRGNAEWIMDKQYGNYRRLALVAHSQEDLESYREQAKEVAHYCERWGMRYEEILGSDGYIKRLIEVTLDPDSVNEDFVLIRPGGTVRLEQFLR